jgi:predicted transcriptional regulator
MDAIGDGWRSTADIRERVGIAITALCNRLNALLALGLVERRNLSGSHYEWMVRK